MHKFTIILLLLLSPLYLYSDKNCQEISCAQYFKQKTNKILSLDEVLSLVLIGSPELAASKWDRKIGEALVIKARQWQNPRLNLMLEDFAGSGNYNDINQSQATILINQLIELGGKRLARKNLALNLQSQSEIEYKLKKSEVLTQAITAFYKVAAKQERQRVLDDDLNFTKNTLTKIKKQVNAGKSSVLELKKVKIYLSQLAIEKEHIEHLLSMGKLALASTWGAKEVLFEKVNTDLFTHEKLPEYDYLLQKLSISPQIEQWIVRQKTAKSELELAKANRIPDLTFGIGARRYEAFDDEALVAELSLPLPLFNNNEGQIEEALALKNKTNRLKHSFEVKVNEILFELYQRLKHADLEMRNGKNIIIPNAEEVLAIASEGFYKGRFSYLELSDAQAILSQARQDYITAALEYHKSYAEINQLLGISAIQSDKILITRTTNNEK